MKCVDTDNYEMCSIMKCVGTHNYEMVVIMKCVFSVTHICDMCAMKCAWNVVCAFYEMCIDIS